MSGTSGADEQGLERAMRNLHEAWLASAESWRDAARDDFERDHIREMEVRTRQAVRHLGELSSLCAEAIRRCS